MREKVWWTRRACLLREASGRFWAEKTKWKWCFNTIIWWQGAGARDKPAGRWNSPRVKCSVVPSRVGAWEWQTQGQITPYIFTAVMESNLRPCDLFLTKPQWHGQEKHRSHFTDAEQSRGQYVVSMETPATFSGCEAHALHCPRSCPARLTVPHLSRKLFLK